MPSPHSTITADPAVRSIIDGALVSGMSPHRIAEEYGDKLGVSRSAVYRYSRSRRSPLTPDWLAADMTVTEAAGDLADVFRDLRKRYDAAGPSTDATRLSNAMNNIGSTLKHRFDADSPEDVDVRAVNAEAVALFATLCRDVPGLIDTARGYDLSDGMIADLNILAARIADEH